MIVWLVVTTNHETVISTKLTLLWVIMCKFHCYDVTYTTFVQHTVYLMQCASSVPSYLPFFY